MFRYCLPDVCSHFIGFGLGSLSINSRVYLRSHAQKYIPGVYLHVCKLYTRVNLAHADRILFRIVSVPGHSLLFNFRKLFVAF